MLLKYFSIVWAYFSKLIVVFFISDFYFAESSDIGRVKMNSVPTSVVLATVIFSSCALIISLTMDKPRPVPFLSLPREESVL